MAEGNTRKGVFKSKSMPSLRFEKGGRFRSSISRPAATNKKKKSLGFKRLFTKAKKDPDTNANLLQPAATNVKKKSLGFKRLLTKAKKAWSKLMESRRKNGVKPVEVDQKTRHGSSVDLAPTLLTLYDDYTTTTINNPSNGNYNDVTKSASTTSFLSRSSPNNNVELLHVPIQRNMSETTVRINGIKTPNGEAQAINAVNNASPVKIIDTSTAVITSNASKRPLSISSTSSSTSSTSSLNRPSCKKMAGDYNSRCQLSPPFERKDCEMDDMQSDDDLLESRVDDVPLLDESDSLIVSPQKMENSESNQSIMDRVVAEVLQTERTYVKDMQEIIEGYLNYFLESSNNLLSSETLEDLFGNIRELHNFNSGLLEYLELCEMDPVKVANCFVDHQNGFSIYADYCTNYPLSMAVLTECMLQPEMADAFKQRQLSLGHVLPLGSYLLKPVQRILKYHLLLQNMLNNVDECMDGYETITEALSGMTNMAQHINEMKRKHEHAVRIQEIQSILYQWQGEDLTTYGELLAEDTFRMYGAKAYRHLFLFEKALLITKRKEDSSLSCKACIMCSNLMLIESIPKEPLSFHVIPFNNPKNQYTLQTKTLDQKRRWCQQIKRLILENYSAIIPDKAKKLVMMLGDSTDGDDRNAENVDPSKHRQHNAPEYLDKRKGRRKSGTFIPDFHILRSQRAKKVLNRKSDVFSSPKSSPPVRRKLSTGDIKVKLSNGEFTRETGNGTPGRSRKFRQPRPRSRSVDYSTELASFIDKQQENGTSRFGPLRENEELIYESQNTPQNTEDDDSVGNGVYNTLKKRLAQFTKRESFRIATELNRVDSKTIADRKTRPKCRTMPKRDQKHHSSSESMDLESDDNSACDSSVNMAEQGSFQDEYVTLAYRDGNVQLVNPPDSDDESLYLNVKLTKSGEKCAKKADNLGEYIDLSEAQKLLLEQSNGKGLSGLPPKPKRNSREYCVTGEESDLKFANRLSRLLNVNPDENDEDGFKLLEEECRSLTLPKTNPCGIYDNLLFGAAYRQHVMQVLSKQAKNAETGEDAIESKFMAGCRRSVSFDENDIPWLNREYIRSNSASSPPDEVPKSPSRQNVNRSQSFSGNHDRCVPDSRTMKSRRKTTMTSFTGLAELFGKGSPHHSRESLSGKYGENHPRKQLSVNSPTSPSRDFLANMLSSSIDHFDGGAINASFSDDQFCGSLSSSRSESLSEDFPPPCANHSNSRLVHSAQSSPIHKPHPVLRLSKTSPFSLSWRNEDKTLTTKTKTELYHDLEKYIADTPDTPPLLPKFPVETDHDDADYAGMWSNVSTPSSDMGIPLQLSSTDSLAGTLKLAVTNLKTKISRRTSNPSSQVSKRDDKIDCSDNLTNSEPNMCRSEDNTEVDAPILAYAPTADGEDVSDTKKFVYQLARSYSNKIKEDKGDFRETIAKQFNAMMSKDTKKPTKPIELGTTGTLTRQRPPRPQKNSSVSSSSTSIDFTCDQMAEMSCNNDTSNSCDVFSDDIVSKETGEEYIRGLQHLASHNSSGSDAGDELSRHDDEPELSPGGGKKQPGRYQGITIRDTVRMIEARNNDKVTASKPPLPKPPVAGSGTLRREKGSMITERLKSLEKSTKISATSPHLSRATKYRDYGIRFTNGAMSDCGGYDEHSSDASEDPGMMSDPGTNRDSQELDVETLANMRGLVKQLVTKFQLDKPVDTDEEC